MLGSLADDTNQAWAEIIDAESALGAFSSEGELVGLTRGFPTELTVPGGEVPAAGVTAVAVLPNHRRQGHLTRLMRAQLDGLVEDGVPVALLVAAEWPIYGRYGYGPAIDACRARGGHPHRPLPRPGVGRDRAGRPLRCSVPTSRPRTRRGASARPVRSAARHGCGTTSPAPTRGRPPRSMSARCAAPCGATTIGTVQGAVAYRVDEGWHRNRPAGKAEVDLLVGATPEAERELWRHLCEIDWVRTVTAGNRGVDDPLPFFVDDGRSVAIVDLFDCIWARILDVPGTLGQRRAALPGTVVVEVTDPLGYAAGNVAPRSRPRRRRGHRLHRDAGRHAAGGRPERPLPGRPLGSAAPRGGLDRRGHPGWCRSPRCGPADRIGAVVTHHVLTACEAGHDARGRSVRAAGPHHRASAACSSGLAIVTGCPPGTTRCWASRSRTRPRPRWAPPSGRRSTRRRTTSARRAQPYMVNYRVDDLEAALLRLRGAGATVAARDRRGRLRAVRLGCRSRGQPVRALGARTGPVAIRSAAGRPRSAGDPGGRATRASASQSPTWSVARTHQRPSAASTTSSPDGTAEGSHEGGRSRAGDLRHGAAGREAKELAPLPLGLGHAGDVRVHGRLDDLMIRRARLEEQVPGGPARGRPRRRDHAGGSGDERQRLLDGPIAGREQLLVEVEEGDGVGPVDPLQHRLGADHDA